MKKATESGVSSSQCEKERKLQVHNVVHDRLQKDEFYGIPSQSEWNQGNEVL